MNTFGFGGLQYVPGLGYVQSPAGDSAASACPTGNCGGTPRFGDEGAVMMISGLGAQPGDPLQAAMPPPKNAPAPLLMDVLSHRVTLFNVELPFWAWLAIAALLGGAGGAGLMHQKMKR